MIESEDGRGKSSLDVLGVRSWINACGWRTVLGGTCMDERVLAAMNEASKFPVDMHELIKKSGERVAELCQTDVGYVVAGCATGIEVVIAACMTEGDYAKWNALPFTENMKNEVVLPRAHRIKYSHHWQAPGAHIVEYGVIAPWWSDQREIESAVSDRTCCLAYVESTDVDPRQRVDLEDVISVARRHDLPVIVDAAAVLPPVANLHRYTDLGADIAIYSGSKAIGGPNDSGIIVGQGEKGRAIIGAIERLSFPSMGWGRSRKLGKEQIVGLVTALEIFVQEGDSEYERQMAIAQYFYDELSDMPHVTCWIIPNDSDHHEHPSMAHVPRVKVEWDSAALELSLRDLEEHLAEGDPPVVVATSSCTYNHYSSRPACILDTTHLSGDQPKIVVDRLREAFLRAS